MDIADPDLRRGDQPFDAGPLVEDLAAVPRTVDRLSVHGGGANLDLLPQFKSLRVLAAREAPPAIMEAALGVMTQLEALDICGTRMMRLDALAHLPLKRLRLVWAPAIVDLGPVGALGTLNVLAIGDLKRVEDFTPLARCRNLKALKLESGMWSPQKIASLAFLRSLTELEELAMHYIAIGDEDLTPICALQNLKFLELPTKYPVRDYARLAVCLPHTICEAFGSHVTFQVGTLAGDGADNEDGLAFTEQVVLVGRPSSGFARTDPKCAPAIAKRAALLEAWRAYYRAAPDPATDRRQTLD